MKEIQLTQGKIVLVDDDDFERLNQFKWHAHFKYNKFYAQRTMHRIDKKTITIRMHRVIMRAEKGIYVDHINGDTLDNRKENLRICTPQQNQFNRMYPQKNNKLGIKGVYWNKRARKFQVQIKINGKQIHLGYFNVLGDADSAFRKAEEKYFGKFVRKVAI